jgi:hypothetical protein
MQQNEELMRNREVATEDTVQTPATQGGHVPSIPTQDGALISSDNDSFISDNESEGGFGDTNADNDGSKVVIPNEGAQGPNFAIDGEGCRMSSQRRAPICGLKQSKFDPCLFIGPNVMCIVYVDDLIFWSRDITITLTGLRWNCASSESRLNKKTMLKGSLEFPWTVTAY